MAVERKRGRKPIKVVRKWAWCSRHRNVPPAGAFYTGERTDWCERGEGTPLIRERRQGIPKVAQNREDLTLNVVWCCEESNILKN